jgi:hypothetical protein
MQIVSTLISVPVNTPLNTNEQNKRWIGMYPHQLNSAMPHAVTLDEGASLIFMGTPARI